MKIGNFEKVNWRRCAGYACVGWLVLYVSTFFIGGMIDYYNPEILLKYFYSWLGG